MSNIVSDLTGALFGSLVCIGVVIVIYMVLWLFWLLVFIDSLKKKDKGWAILLFLSALTGFMHILLALLYLMIGRDEEKEEEKPKQS